MSRSTALILMTMVVAMTLKSARVSKLVLAIVVYWDNNWCIVNGVEHCCGNEYTVRLVASNGQVKSCDCQSTPGQNGYVCLSSATGLSGTILATALAAIVASFLKG
nr:hypothetical protein BaRGS_023544 [Batillaria attramentaria]